MTIVQQLCIASMTSRHIMLCLFAGELLSVSQVSTDAENVTTLAVAAACVIASQECNKSCHDGVQQTEL